ncbi:S1C family serine protease [Raineya orbicola]|jgi:S1-C subfamily serine protease|uniref:Trypsin-like peptidase domain n=1 Tax=Raineya orbicola TaxID=2016530 RepID=A0A2N3I7N6_9BACT|nr:serine protease [Raineya orbicola]PKQ66306.1 Trypsin-like peptidase domain [Raineya orbicola]
MNLQQKYEWIENYLAGKLEGNDLSDFEAKMQNDPAFAQEVEEHKFLLETLAQMAQREQLKAQMNLFHKDLDKHKAWVFYKHPIIQNFWKKHFPTMAVAASVAILTAVGVLWNVKNFNQLEDKQTAYFRSLKKDIDDVKKRQNSLEEKSEKENITQPIDHTATAFVISANGYLLTNYHAVKDADAIFAESRQDSLQRYQVKVFYKDEKTDLAVLKIEDSSFRGFRNLPYALRLEADLGEEVFTLAYPREDMVYGKGEISARTGFEGDSLEYQISVPVNPGNSGAPLFDDKGFLIGVINRKHTLQEGAAFAIKAKYIKKLIDSVMQGQKPEKPILLPLFNNIAWLKRPQQIKALQNYVFELKVHKATDITASK